MIPRPGTQPVLIEFLLETARDAVRRASVMIPFDSVAAKREGRDLTDDVYRAIGALEKALTDVGLMTWDTPIGRQAEYVLDRTLDTISVALAQGMTK